MVTAKIEYEDGTGSYGRFIVEPLEGGFGITLGSALRRVLLALLPGAAITAVKIEEVEHEFSTIPHVREDTMEFLLNVKELRLRPSSERPGRLTLEARGQGRVCAGDIKPSADFEIVNPELHLATLDSDEAKLTVEFFVEQGKGYIPAGHSDGLPIGVIPVDAIFTPIRKVNYAVDKIRVGQLTNCDRLTLEVWTDGTISAIEALDRSAQILIDGLSLFHELTKPPPTVEEPSLGLSITLEQYNMPIEQLGLSVRTLNSLRRSKLTKVGEILEKREEELLRGIKNFGQKSLEELRERLEMLGLVAGRQVEEEAETRIEEGQEAKGAEEGEELKDEASGSWSEAGPVD